ncbi:MAG: tRNA (guanosine(37)-N1)-methyltransferase TrmD [Bacilli bacterium]|nr:tRNA (guanosine(37)-N1)-methyltransferase TrmD [Bacilli bacterium]
MVKFNVLTLFPEMFNGFKEESIIKRAIEDKKIKIDITNLRDYSSLKHNQVDDTPYGGGSGMVLMCDPVFKAVDDLKKKNTKIIMMTPQGKTFNQEKAEELSKEKDILIICGHYEGFDERIRSIVDEEISIGDYVLTGGELPSMVLMDSVSRLVDGVIDEGSRTNDSFSDDLLDYPTFTKPREYRGMKVPEVLLSGDHKKIDKWRKEEAIKKTREKRPDLIKPTFRKEIGDYGVYDYQGIAQGKDIKLTGAYEFNPKRRDLYNVNKVLLVDPVFVKTIAKKSLEKKLKTLFNQIEIVLNDESDDEAGSYVLGEIERMQSLILTFYGKYLDDEYLALLLFKLDAFKSEIAMKEMKKIDIVDMRKNGRRR